ncbi:N-formylglutamate amidohydrolase [Chloroflexota bacterium]
MSKYETAKLVILHIPHSSKIIPQDILKSFILRESELQAELIRMTDSYTEELFDIKHPLVAMIIYPVSRLVVDPERFIDDQDEPMSEKGMGVVYTKTSFGHELREPLSKKQRESLILEYYVPHHKKLTKAVTDAITTYEKCIIIDCHSFPSTLLPSESDQSPNRPDICIGTDEFHTPAWIEEMTVNLFTKHGYKTDLNRPFSGSMVPATYYRINPRVMSVMIEVNRSLYMNDETGLKNSEFSQLKNTLHMIIQSLIGTAYESGS